MKNKIIKYKLIIISFLLFSLLTSYDKNKVDITEEEKVLEIRKSLDRTEKEIIRINKLLNIKEE